MSDSFEISPSLERRLELLLGKTIVTCQSAKGGYTSAHRLLVECHDGTKAFAKVATDSLTASWLRTENLVYQNVSGKFMAMRVAWDDHQEQPILILEDLGTDGWSVSWNQEKVHRVLETLELVRKSPCPKGLPTLQSIRHELVSWHLVAKNPEPFLRLGLCSRKWLDENMSRLISAENAAKLSGSELIHLDVRSDNLCFLSNRVVLVDWNWACIGNALVDVVAWLPSLCYEGGPRPEEIIDGEPELVTLFAGFWAYRAGMPPLGPDNSVREIQLAQLKKALPWCAKVLGLELELPPTRLTE